MGRYVCKYFLKVVLYFAAAHPGVLYTFLSIWYHNDNHAEKVPLMSYVYLMSLYVKMMSKVGSCLLWVMSTEISVDIAVDIAVDSRSTVGRQSVDSWSIVGR